MNDKKDNKVTMKIERDVYKELQKFKIEHDECKTLSDAIKLSLNCRCGEDAAIKEED